MAFRPDKLTVKAAEAVQTAQGTASERGNPQVVPLHLLAALLGEVGGIVTPLFQRIGVNLPQLKSLVESELSRLPRQSGGQTGASQAFMTVLDTAQKAADTMKDTYVSTEHLLLALVRVDDTAGRLLKMNGVDEDDLMTALKAVRGGQSVQSQNPETTYQALQQYGKDLVDLARKGK
ncbi:MAG TPA: Clp protease N-terminal domain-containing protein, partial [Planctomycetaceae bacterium]